MRTAPRHRWATWVAISTMTIGAALGPSASWHSVAESGVCPANTLAIANWVSSLYAGSDSGLTEAQVADQMESAAQWLCENSTFLNATGALAPENVSMGLALAEHAPFGNGTFLVVWVAGDLQHEDIWTVNLVSGTISGPTTRSGPIAIAGGPSQAPAHDLIASPVVWVAATGTALAAAGVAVLVARRRRRANP